MDTEPIRRTPAQTNQSNPYPSPQTWRGEPPRPSAPPTDPYISGLKTAKNTERMSHDIAAIMWICILMLLLLIVITACDVIIAAKISTLIPVGGTTNGGY